MFIHNKLDHRRGDLVTKGDFIQLIGIFGIFKWKFLEFAGNEMYRKFWEHVFTRFVTVDAKKPWFC